jgi:hypothetical protein
MTAARPVDHASRMEASQARLTASRRLCLSTAVIVRETRATIDRALEMLDTRSDAQAGGSAKRPSSCASLGSCW